MVSLPGHNYLGPGNQTDNGPCVDKDDAIAMDHDLRYRDAETPEDVQKADLDAIQKFRADWVSMGNWHSLLGDLGLSAKYFVETYTGVIYPFEFSNIFFQIVVKIISTALLFVSSRSDLKLDEKNEKQKLFFHGKS